MFSALANKWSLAYAIAGAFVREGASLYLTFQGERQRQTVEELGAELNATNVLPCDVTKPEELEQLVSHLNTESPVIDAVVHSIAFANREDLSRPFLETSRDGYPPRPGCQALIPSSLWHVPSVHS